MPDMGGVTEESAPLEVGDLFSNAVLESEPSVLAGQEGFLLLVGVGSKCERSGGVRGVRRGLDVVAVSALELGLLPLEEPLHLMRIFYGGK